jgi:hypothetical protein
MEISQSVQTLLGWNIVRDGGNLNVLVYNDVG